VRTPLTGVTCDNTSTPSGFSCSARLPAMTAGPHTLQLASTLVDGALLESDRSASLRVTVTAQTAGDLRPPGDGERSAPRMTPGSVVTADGTRLRLEPVVDGLDRPTDLAFTPDGRLLVAERGGTVRIVPRGARWGEASPTFEPALSLADPAFDTALLALAVDPQFARTRFVFALYTAPARSGEAMFTLARFRESGGTLADRIVLLDGVAAGLPEPVGTMRFGPDGTLYAAFDDGGDAQRRGDLASFNGKVVRLNPDGTTPRDQPGATPVYAEGYGAPTGLAWDARRAPPTLWVADRDGGGGLRAVVADARSRAGEKRAAVHSSYALPRASVPTSIAFYAGALIPAFSGRLLVASNDGRHLLAIGGERAEPLLQDRVGGITAVAIAPDGAIYVANASSIGRLVPEAR
jgi:glucose/arabinose dehydrogenase